EVPHFEAKLRSMIGGGGKEKVETAMVDNRTMAQLHSLGYLSGLAARSFELGGQGIDPKDRVGILRLIRMAGEATPHLSDSQRIALLRQALQDDPSNPELYYEVGTKLEKAGRYADALKIYRSALGKGIENGRFHSRIADLLVLAGNKEAAIPEYEKAAQLNPSDVESQTNLAAAYLEKGRVPDAERVLRWAIATDPAYAPAYNALGLVAIQKQDPASARGYFIKAVELNPNLPEPQLNLGLIYKMEGDRAHARACFETFLAKASPKQYSQLIPKVREELAALR
ncbi:MAG TPA: tetratricopeptide repeat protein, partial [Bryobacteraceae bacterium]